MEFLKRHEGHMHMSDSASSMVTSATSAVMDMASATMSMTMSSSTSSSSGMAMEGMDHGSSHMAMNMWLTASFKDYPVVFKDLRASTKAQAFGIFVLLFFVAFLARMLEFVRNYLEEIVWKNNNYAEVEQGISQHSANLQSPPVKSCCDDNAKEVVSDESIDKQNSPQHEETTKARGTGKSLSLASTISRDIIRLALCIIPDLFAYSLMLAAMTYTLTYFFAVVIGSGVGRFVAERLMEHYRIKRGPPRNCC